MARTSISISDALREKLNQHKERINISAVCCRALEKEIQLMERRDADAKDAALLLVKMEEGEVLTLADRALLRRIKKVYIEVE